MQYDSWKRQRINVSDIELDPDNIRLDVGQKSQKALIADLFENEDAMQMLESIVSNGILPDELPIVVKDGDRYTVLEGNRRLAAMKAINNPGLIAPFTSKISILAATFPKIKDIEVMVAPTREEAQPYLGNRHTINTRRQWKPLRQAHFYKAQLEAGKSLDELNHEYPGIDIPKFVRMWEMHHLISSISLGDEELDKKVRNQRTFPITTLERLYDDKAFRSAMGLDFDEYGRVKVSATKAEFEAALKKIALDIVDRDSPDHVDSRTLNNSANILGYVQKLRPPAKVPDGKKLGAEDFKAHAPEPIPAPTSGASAPTPTLPRRRLAPQDVVITVKSVGVQRMLIELQNIDYHRFPIAAHNLLRSFLECALKAFYAEKGHTVVVKNQKPGGKVQLDALLADFVNPKNNFGNQGLRQLAQSIKTNSTMLPYSAESLNATNHNPDIFPTPKNVEDGWDGLDALLRFILKP